MSNQIELYNGLMNEARYRIEAVERLLARSNMPPRIIEELCYLQLRLLCEVIALACLVAHGNVRTRKLLRETKPAIIFKQMEELHADFYPRAIIPTLEGGGLRIDPKPGPWLTKDELKSLWAKSGNELHRGNVGRLLSSSGPAPVNLATVQTWIQKIRNLLTHHHISSRDNKLHYIVWLSDDAHNGNATVVIGQSV